MKKTRVCIMVFILQSPFIVNATDYFPFEQGRITIFDYYEKNQNGVHRYIIPEKELCIKIINGKKLFVYQYLNGDLWYFHTDKFGRYKYAEQQSGAAELKLESEKKYYYSPSQIRTRDWGGIAKGQDRQESENQPCEHNGKVPGLFELN